MKALRLRGVSLYSVDTNNLRVGLNEVWLSTAF